MRCLADSLRAAAAAAMIAFAGVCAAEAAAPATVPDDSVLAESEAEVEEAREAGAEEKASVPLREARRRLSAARDLLFRAAAANREPSEAEQRRIRRLADEAYLDARLALSRAEAEAAADRLAELRSELAASGREGRP